MVVHNVREVWETQGGRTQCKERRLWLILVISLFYVVFKHNRGISPSLLVKCFILEYVFWGL